MAKGSKESASNEPQGGDVVEGSQLAQDASKDVEAAKAASNPDRGDRQQPPVPDGTMLDAANTVHIKPGGPDAELIQDRAADADHKDA